MNLKQLICFSWNENGKKKGYHVFARSNGIDERDVNTVIERLAYLPPKNITAATLEKLAETSRLLGYPSRGDSGLHFVVQREIDAVFPTDCAFFMLPSGECCCARVTYCGVDYRLSVWGNYIIHAYIFPYDKRISPVSLLMSQKFKTRILPRELQVCDTQRPLPLVEVEESAYTTETVGQLLRTKGAASMSRILDCIFAAIHENMDIYINGNEDDVLFWMLACQSVLPVDIVMLLSFSTCRFSDSDGSPFRIKHIITKLGNHYNYKLSPSDTSRIVVDPKNKIFSDRVPKLQLSSLMTYLLMNEPSEAEVLRDLIGTYLKTHGAIDSDDICLIYRLARTDIYDGISEIELCEALGGIALRSFGSDTVDRVIEKYLEHASNGMLKVKLYGLLASYHTSPEQIMSAMFYRAIRELAEGRMNAHDALDIFTEEDFGRETFRYILRSLDEKRVLFEHTMANAATRSFVFRLLFAGFCDFSEKRAADILVELIESAIKSDFSREGEIPSCINELISVTEYDEMTYRRVVYGYYDYCRVNEDEFASWCELVVLLFEQGRKLSSEAGLCAFIMRELDYGALLQYMRRGDTEACRVLYLLSSLHRFGSISDRTYSDFVYGKFNDFLSRSSDAKLISLVIDGLKNDNARLIEALSNYVPLTDRRTVFDIYKSTVGDGKSADNDFLLALHTSDVRYIGTAIVGAGIVKRDAFLEYLKNWYSKGYYKKCFAKSFTKLSRDVPEGEMWYFLSTVFALTGERFGSQRADFELWIGALAQKIERYIGRETNLVRVLSEAKAVTNRNGSKLPIPCEIILQTEAALDGKGDISLAMAREFTERSSADLRDVYVRLYGVRLMGLCVSDMDHETISAAVWLALLCSDREHFKKLVRYSSKLGSASMRILLGRVADARIIEKDADKVEEMIVALAKNMKISDYISLKKRIFSQYGEESYGEIFTEAEEKFGILARKKLEKIK